MQALSSKEYTEELGRTMKPETPVGQPEEKAHLLSIKGLLAGILLQFGIGAFASLSVDPALAGLLIAASAFFSMAEISLAAARRLRLRQMADEGDARADRVLRMQEQPGDYFTVVQVGQNAVAILGGIVGEGALSQSVLLAWLAASPPLQASVLEPAFASA